MFKNLFYWYGRELHHRPILTKAWTSGFLACLGDYACQKYENLETSKKLDSARLLRFSAVATMVTAPTLHYWYGLLNRYIQGSGFIPGVKRVFMDQAFFSPFMISTIFFTNSTFAQVQENGIKNVDVSKSVNQIKTTLAPTLVTNYFVWIPVQLVNFSVVLPQYQVLFQSFISLGWNGYLSYQAAKSAVTQTSSLKLSQ